MPDNCRCSDWRALCDGSVRLEIAASGPDEVHGIAGEIERLNGEGVPYRQQAVLARTHTILGRVADGLEAAGVPVLYLGNLFERPEVRDLLALVSLASEGVGTGLLRVAAFPEYAIPLADVRELLVVARAADEPFPRALRLAEGAKSISPAGRARIALLARHLDGLTFSGSTWGLLAEYLFGRGRYLRDMLNDDSAGARQRRLALYQFLQVVHERRAVERRTGLEEKRAFLAYVRSIQVHGDAKQLRQMPEGAAGFDAVRLLTIHGSKGLEFSVVYLPWLGARHYPMARQHGACPPLDGMEAAEDGHADEEECLFFVALSRARDGLVLSRSETYGRQNSKPSAFLGKIARYLPGVIDGPVTWAVRPTDEPAPMPPLAPDTGEAFEARDLDVYIECPRRYYYRFVLGLNRRQEDVPYLQFHSCVYGVMRWIDEERAVGRTPSAADALAHLAALWGDNGPVNHPYEPLYRRGAEAITARTARNARRDSLLTARPSVEIPLPHGRVRFTPDQFEADPETGTPTALRRVRTGRPSKSEREHNIYGLYASAVSTEFPGACIETAYLSTDETKTVDLGPKTVNTRLGRYDAAINGIRLGVFPAEPNERICPRCPFYFVCPQGDPDDGRQ